MDNQPRTLAQIQGTINTARDSVWVVTNEIERLAAGQPTSKEIKNNLDRNVAHLKLIVSNQEVIDSGEDITDLVAATAAGEAKLAEQIWPIEPA